MTSQDPFQSTSFYVTRKLSLSVRLTWSKIGKKHMPQYLLGLWISDHPVKESFMHCTTSPTYETSKVRKAIERKCMTSLYPSTQLKGSCGTQGLKILLTPED